MSKIDSLWVRYSFSGLLLGIGFIVEPLWFLVFGGIWFFVQAVDDSLKARQYLLGGGLAFFIKMLLVHAWGVYIYPLDWYQPALAQGGWWGIAIYWLLGSLFLSVGGLILAALIRPLRFKPHFQKWSLIALAWVFAETINSYIFSVLTLGGDSYISDAYSYGFIGYLLASHNWLIYIAKLGGVYALTIAAVMLVGLVLYFLKFNKYYVITGVAIFLLLGVVPQPEFSRETKVSVALIETDFDALFLEKDKEVFDQYKFVEEAIDAAILNEADYVVLPEAAQYTNLNFGPEGAYNLYRFKNKDTDTILVDSGQGILPNNQAIIRATIYDGQNKQAWQFDKQYLVPQGEYMPGIFSLLFRAMGLSEEERTKYRVEYVPGPIVGQVDMPSHLPRVLFCFSSADPRAVRRLVSDNKEIPFVAHITSHAWFHEPVLLWKQQEAMLKIQAVWGNVPILQSANLGRAMVYLPNGKSYQPELVASGERWRVMLVSI